MYGISNEVYLSLPCVLNSAGVNSVINTTLSDREISQLKNSADTLWNIQKDLKDVWRLDAAFITLIHSFAASAWLNV